MENKQYGVLNDAEIAELCKGDYPMISPFVGESTNSFTEMDGDDECKFYCPSFGLSSCGYDVRLGNKFIKPIGVSTAFAVSKNGDPAKHDEFLKAPVRDLKPGKVLVVDPGDFFLAHTMERFIIPPDIRGVCNGKSTLARMGIHLMVTPLEPNWEGYLTLEFANLSKQPVLLTPGIGIAQIEFHRVRPPEVGYSHRDGKYMNQPAEPVPPIIRTW